MPDSLGNCVFINDITYQEIESAVKNLNDWISIKNDPILER
jgi:hypothetical protein